MQEVAADLVRGQVAFESPGPGGRQSQLAIGKVGRDRADRHGRSGIARRRDQHVGVVALHLRLHLERGVAGLRQGVADDVAEEPVCTRPAEQPGRPAALRVARPGHHTSQPVLPGREHWIASGTLQDHVRRSPRCRGDITTQGRKRVDRHPRERLEERGEMGGEGSLDDPRFEGLARLLEKDLRHVSHGVADVRAAVAPLRDLAHQHGVGPVRTRRDRGHRDAFLVQRVDDGLVVVVGRVAVAQQDDVLERRLAFVQLRRGCVEVGPIARRVAEIHRRDARLDLRLVSEPGQLDHDVAAHSVGHSD